MVVGGYEGEPRTLTIGPRQEEAAPLWGTGRGIYSEESTAYVSEKLRTPSAPCHAVLERRNRRNKKV